MFYVEMIDAGCECCSYVTVASFENYSEAKEFIKADPDNYTIEGSFEHEEVGEMQEAIQRVREVHKETFDGFCVACVTATITTSHSQRLSVEVTAVEYPCPTIKALDGEQE